MLPIHQVREEAEMEKELNFDWSALFADAIRHVGPRLSVALDLSDCRERWLQAEMYFYLRQFDPEFRIGHIAVARGSKADFFGMTPAPMIGELKVLGSGYHRKCFDGSGSIPSCFTSSDAGVRTHLTDEHLLNAGGYFLHDVHRMRSFIGDYERYVILVVDQRPPLDDLGAALLSIQVAEEETTVESPTGDWLARIWKIQRDPIFVPEPPRRSLP